MNRWLRGGLVAVLLGLAWWWGYSVGWTHRTKDALANQGVGDRIVIVRGAGGIRDLRGSPRVIAELEHERELVALLAPVVEFIAGKEWRRDACRQP